MPAAYSDEKAEAILARNEKLKSDRQTLDTTIQTIADLMMPRKSQISSAKTPGVTGYSSEIIDMTAAGPPKPMHPRRSATLA